MGIQQIPLASSGLTQSQLITAPNWTLLQTTSANNVTALHITGLSGYKRYKVFVSNLLVVANGDYPYWFLNNDLTNHIVWQNFSDRGSTKTVTGSAGLTNVYYMTTNGWRNDSYQPCGYIEINNADSTSAKQIESAGHFYSSGGNNVHFEGFGISVIAAPISQISVAMPSGDPFYMNQIYVYGAN